MLGRLNAARLNVAKDARAASIVAHDGHDGGHGQGHVQLTNHCQQAAILADHAHVWLDLWQLCGLYGVCSAG